MIGSIVGDNWASILLRITDPKNRIHKAFFDLEKKIMKTLSCMFTACAFMLLGWTSGVSCKNNESLLIKSLLKDYDPLSLPVHNPKTDLVNCSMGIYLLQIIQVSEKYQAITVSLWIHFTWDDINVRWDPLE